MEHDSERQSRIDEFASHRLMYQQMGIWTQHAEVLYQTALKGSTEEWIAFRIIIEDFAHQTAQREDAELIPPPHGDMTVTFTGDAPTGVTQTFNTTEHTMTLIYHKNSSEIWAVNDDEGADDACNH